MKLIDFSQTQELKKTKLPAIRKSLVGTFEIPRRLIVTDQQSLSSIIECEVGDHLLVDASVSPQNDSLHTLPSINGKQLFVAARRGVTSLRAADGTTFKQVRIMAHQFVGLNRYLYLPDPDEDDEL